MQSWQILATRPKSGRGRPVVDLLPAIAQKLHMAPYDRDILDVVISEEL